MNAQGTTLYVRDTTSRRYRKAQPTEIVASAETAIDTLFCRGTQITCVADTKQFLVTKLACKEAEVFAVMFLDNKHKLIAFEELFQGTINCAAVYPREVAKRALHLNAAALIATHCHPSSGNPEPSRADEVITLKLKEALNLLDIRLLDHLIVGGTNVVSLAERGII